MSAWILLIDRLRGGKTQKIDEKLSPEFMGPEEKELKFKSEVSIQGKAYMTDEHLVIQLTASTTFLMPCSICNEMIENPLKSVDFYHLELVENIKSAQFDFRPALREALLLELPRTVECSNGKCPQRETIAPYMHREDHASFPFADLNEDKLGDNDHGCTT